MTVLSNPMEISVSNASEQEPSVWRVFKEVRTSNVVKTQTYEVSGVSRHDGFTVTVEGSYKNGVDENFICRGSFGQFRFIANRVDELNGDVLDKYTVYLHTYTTDKEILLCKCYSKDIKSALLHLPVSRHFHNKPVCDVMFEIGTETNHRLVSAAEL